METEKFIFELIKTVVLLGGVVWAFYRFRVESPHKPRIEFDIKAKFIGPIEEYYAVQFDVIATNKGLRTRRFEQIYLNVKGIKEGAGLEEWEKDPPRLLTPEKIIRNAELVYKKNYAHIFVEPGITQSTTYFTRIPSNIKIISARATFQYTKDKSHSAERLIQVKHESA